MSSKRRRESYIYNCILTTDGIARSRPALFRAAKQMTLNQVPAWVYFFSRRRFISFALGLFGAWIRRNHHASHHRVQDFKRGSRRIIYATDDNRSHFSEWRRGHVRVGTGWWFAGFEVLLVVNLQRFSVDKKIIDGGFQIRVRLPIKGAAKFSR